jgi:hypothetical protein
MLNLCGIVAVILKMASDRHFSMSGINLGHHNLPTYEISFISTGRHFQNGRHNTAKIQHCSISKVAFDLFFKPVVSGRFGRLHNRSHMKFHLNRTMLNLCGIVAAILKMAIDRNFSISGINLGHHNLPIPQKFNIFDIIKI